MPKPLIAVAIRRSRLSLAFQLLVGLGLALYAGWWIDYRYAAIAAFIAVAMAARQYLASPKQRDLRCMHENEQPVWESSEDAQAWQKQTCRLIRLGPLLLAIELSGHRSWLWPDSSDAQSLRQLRETLSEQGDHTGLSP
ncbi:hypothetical protein [Salinicola socius]|uniref:Toxin CptA n=1 Tax=Salinicola socius TaxID=404433 RepID=A0A1Q8SQP0_9GAMM|nr:hypothetical protein [Salinicola socius]OLO03737.1 hypothetical protein BTW07_12640 [Salinicola socius]